jgi:hypothetical protein
MNSLQATMNRVKRALGLPETIGVLGLGRMCPLLVFFGVLIVAALAVILLN